MNIFYMRNALKKRMDKKVMITEVMLYLFAVTIEKHGMKIFD